MLTHFRRLLGAVCLGGFALGSALVGTALAHSPHDVVKLVAVSPDYPQDGTVLVSAKLSDHEYLARSTDFGKSWHVYSAQMLASDPTAIRFSPDYATDATIYISTLGSGVWRSVDGGSTWGPMNAGLGTFQVVGLAISPDFARDRLLIAATKIGAYRSEDAGATWSLSNVGLVSPVVSTVEFGAVLSTPPIVYAGDKVLHASRDGGLTWMPRTVFSIPMERIATWSDARVVDHMVVCFGRFGGGIQASTNGGMSFVPMVTGLTDPFVYDLAFADDGVIYASTKVVGCFRAAAIGQPFTISTAGLESPSDQSLVRYPGVAVSPAHSSDHVVWLAAFEGVHSSIDGGTNWKQGDIYSQRLNRRLAFAPDFADSGDLWLGNYGGGMLRVQFPPAPPPSVVPAPPAVGHGISHGSVSAAGGTGSGSQPSGPLVSWSGVPPAPEALLSSHLNGIGVAYTDVVGVSPGYANDDTVYYGHLGLFRSTDRGEHWTQTGYAPSNARALALSPEYPSDGTLFVGSGGDGVWRSTDFGESFTLLSNGIPADHRANAIECSPDFARDGTLFVVSKTGTLHRSVDGGDSFVQLDNGLPLGEVLSHVRCSPDFGRDGTVYATAHGSGVYVSIDGGDSWAASNGGLPSGEVLDGEAVALSPDFAVDRTLFVVLATQGVWRSQDAGATWSFAGAGLPLDAPRAIELSPAFPQDHTVVVTTMDWAWCSRDAGLTWTRLPGYIRVDDTVWSVQTSSTWTLMQSVGNSGVGIRSCSQTGGYQEYSFYGDGVSFYTNLGPTLGNVEVYVDGASQGVYSLLSRTPVIQTELCAFTFPEVGWHTLRVRNAGPNGGNPNSKVVSDGFASRF